MFKPSLKRSVLNNNLCLTSQNKTEPFSFRSVQKPKAIERFVDTMSVSQPALSPSMMIPEEILQKHEFHNQNNYTHIFTPLSYDFKAYPMSVKQKISSNPKAAQAGRINQVNYVVFKGQLILWKSVNNGQQQDLIKIHNFKQLINIVTFAVINSEKLFKTQRITVLAIAFENRVKLFKLNETSLDIEDLMMKFQIKSCRYIQKIYFTQKNEIVIAGDSGQFCMISLNSSQSLVVKVKSSIIKKYLSKSAFDYSTRHMIRGIQVSDSFLYCLHDRISRSNSLMYFLKKTVHKIIQLSQEPKYVKEETFVDVYKFTNKDRNQLIFLTQLRQDDVQKKVKQGYVNFWGEGVKDSFRIVAINCKAQQNASFQNEKKLAQKQSDSSSQVLSNATQKTKDQINPIIQLTTKCGYVVTLIHDHLDRQGSQGNKENFSFASQPTKLPSKIGEASLFEPKVFISAPQQKEYRKNYVLKSLPLSKNEKMILLSDSLMLSNNQQVSSIAFNDLKFGIYDTTTQEETYVNEEEFNRAYQPYKLKRNSQTQGLFEQRIKVYNVEEQNKGNKYFRLFNNQKRWTCFGNEGRFHIYPLEVKHILLAYLYYQCEFSSQNYKNTSEFDQNTNFLIQSDLRLHSTIEKIIRLYGYTVFMRALLEILINNSNDQREYFYLQRNLFLEVVKRDFQYQLANSFEDWSYNLSECNEAQKIVPTDKMLQFLWITLFDHQNKPVLTSETIISQNPISQYAEAAKQYEEVKSQIQYTAYGYALKSIFSQIIEILIYFRAKQFKFKQKKLKQCQIKLANLFNFLQVKKIKSETQEYKTYIDIKMTNLSRKKQPYQKFPNKNLNTTQSTTLSSLNNSTNESFTGIDEEPNTTSVKRGVAQQSNQNLQKNVHKAIQKIISLIDVMNILIQKDERQGLPNFIEIVTNFKNQIKIGEQFFKEELFFSPNNVEFIHPELVKQVNAALPELNLQTKIDFLKFKLAKNIAVSNSLNEVDLKSLNFAKLSELVTSQEISQVRKIFLGEEKELSLQKQYFYTQFLTISLVRVFKKVKQLSAFKQQKFNSLLEEKELFKKNVGSLTSNFAIEKIIISQQQLEYYQEEASKIFSEIKSRFSGFVKNLKDMKSPQYYEAESYLDRMIELLTTNFGTQQIIVQTLETILKDGGFFEKIQYMKQVRSKIMYLKDSDVQILKIAQQKETKLKEKSTFQYLIETQIKKHLGEDKTQDTLNAESLR